MYLPLLCVWVRFFMTVFINTQRDSIKNERKRMWHWPISKGVCMVCLKLYIIMLWYFVSISHFLFLFRRLSVFIPFEYTVINGTHTGVWGGLLIHSFKRFWFNTEFIIICQHKELKNEAMITKKERMKIFHKEMFGKRNIHGFFRWWEFVRIFIKRKFWVGKERENNK